ncbi:MAG: glycosyltransferase [Cyanobacteriota bacterium]|jgi:glycosyltransferase involved in cell wall biosynthesis
MSCTRLLFAAPHCLLDRTSGAAITLQALLAALVRRGVSVRSLEAACFDSPAGAEGLELPAPPAAGLAQMVRRQRDGVVHDLLVSAHQERTSLTTLEEMLYETAFLELLARFRPHVVLGFGAYGLERSLRREARLQGAGTIFYLANPSYNHLRYFRDVDRVVTDTAATATLYRRSLGLIAQPIGLFIDPQRVVAAQREPEWITFVNPIQEKGACLMVGLAQLCLAQLPEARFLVVESRGRWAPLLAQLGVAPESLPNVEVWPHQSDMRAVYSRSRVVLMPSCWHESAGMVALEALMNGLPVLASDHGGLAETLRGAATLIPIPVEVRSQLAIPAPAVLAPWLEALSPLLRDETAYRQASQRALAAGQAYSSETGVTTFLTVIDELRASLSRDGRRGGS